MIAKTPTGRVPTEEELCHERLGDRFAEALSDYDTTRRLEVLVDDFLTEEMLRGKRVLDVGCGLGFFSERLMRRTLEAAGANIERESGLHLFPFQIQLPRLSRLCDRRLQRLRGLMINICVLARKR